MVATKQHAMTRYLVCAPVAFCAAFLALGADTSAVAEKLEGGDKAFEEGKRLSSSKDHAGAVRNFVAARKVYGKWLSGRVKFRECNRQIVKELAALARLERDNGNHDRALLLVTRATEVQKTDRKAFADESNWRVKPVDLYEAAHAELFGAKQQKKSKKQSDDAIIGEGPQEDLVAKIKRIRAENSKPRKSVRTDGFPGDKTAVNSSACADPDRSVEKSIRNCSISTICIAIVGVIIPALCLIFRKRRKATFVCQPQSASMSSQAMSATTQKTTPEPLPKPVYSFEERNVRDFVEGCRVHGMPHGTTNDFRLAGGECIYGRMSPASLLETISATNLNMRHISTGTLYATNRRFVYVVGGDVRVIPYNDVIKFESDNLFGFEGSVSIALSSRRKRMEFLGPNSFSIMMGFGYTTDPAMRNLIQSISKVGPNDPGLEIFIQKLLSSQTQPTEESVPKSASGCLNALWSLVVCAAIIYGIYKVFCWIVSTASVN